MREEETLLDVWTPPSPSKKEEGKIFSGPVQTFFPSPVYRGQLPRSISHGRGKE